MNLYGTPEEMLERAKAGYFVRGSGKESFAYCPAGRSKAENVSRTERSGIPIKMPANTVRTVTSAISGKGGWKEIDFTKDTLEKAKDWIQAEGNTVRSPKQTAKCHFEKVKGKISFCRGLR